MHDKEILYFTEAMELFMNNFYIDAIQKLESLAKEFPDSDLADDAEYNRALCYYDMNFFEQSKNILKALIEKYPAATISALANANEFGRTAAKAYYLIVNCCLALKQSAEAKAVLPELKKYTDSYVIKDNSKSTFYDLAVKTIEMYGSFVAHDPEEG